MPRRATIGPEIYARVTELVAAGQTRTKAFAQVAEERGQQAGAVSAHYYRVARSQPNGRVTRRATPKPRRRVAKAVVRPRQTPPALTAKTDGDIQRAADEIVKLTQELVRQVKERDRKIRSLLR